MRRVGAFSEGGDYIKFKVDRRPTSPQSGVGIWIQGLGLKA